MVRCSSCWHEHGTGPPLIGGQGGQTPFVGGVDWSKRSSVVGLGFAQTSEPRRGEPTAPPNLCFNSFQWPRGSARSIRSSREETPRSSTPWPVCSVSPKPPRRAPKSQSVCNNSALRHCKLWPRRNSRCSKCAELLRISCDFGARRGGVAAIEHTAHGGLVLDDSSRCESTEPGRAPVPLERDRPH